MRALLGLILALALAPSVLAAQSHLLVVSGLSGEPQYSELFHSWARTLVEAATQRLGLAPEQVQYLAEDPQRDPALIKGRADKAGIEQALIDLAARAQPEDKVFIVLIGHGNARRGLDARGGATEVGSAEFNIPGPDLAAEDFVPLLARFAKQQVVFINLASASGAFVPILAAPGRVVISATASPSERYFAQFGGYFVRALAEPGADADKDQRVSLLEAFDYARREIQRLYEGDNRLQTEHALLDDDGDGEGSTEVTADGSDGALARTLFLAGDRVAAVQNMNPELAALLQEKQDLEQQLEDLKSRKEQLPAEEYESQLEELLVELALKNQAIRTQEEKL